MTKTTLTLAALATLTLLPGCLLHIGDPENRRSVRESVELTLGPGQSVTQRFVVTADEQAAPRLLDLAAIAEVRSGGWQDAEGAELELRLRDLDTAEEVLATGERGSGELFLDCGMTGSCSGRFEAEVARVDTAPTTWTGVLEVQGTGRVTCCGALPGELQVQLE